MSPPRPFEFSVASLRAGRTSWFAGVCGDRITVVDDIFGVKTPKWQKEASIVGEVVGGEVLSFELHKVDYSAANVHRLIQLKERIERGDLSANDSTIGEDSGEESGKCKKNDAAESIGMIEAFKAFDLGPRRSIRLKFKDISSIDICGDSMTLRLHRPPCCYAKRSGKPRTSSLEAVQDFTGGATTITFKSHRAALLQNVLKHQSPQLESLFRIVAPQSSPEKAPAIDISVIDVTTPTSRKRDRESEHVEIVGKQAKRRSRVPEAAAGQTERSVLDVLKGAGPMGRRHRVLQHRITP